MIPQDNTFLPVHVPEHCGAGVPPANQKLDYEESRRDACTNKLEKKTTAEEVVRPPRWLATLTKESHGKEKREFV